MLPKISKDSLGRSASMQREMLFFERFMYVDGTTPINCIMTVRVRGEMSAETIQKALDAVQRKHPLLRCKVGTKHGAPQFMIDVDIPRVPIRITDRHSDKDWQAATEEEWKRTFDTMSGPLLRLVWLKGAEVSELMFVAHHCICDGGSMMMLIREVLQCMDDPTTELTPYSPYATIEDIVPSDAMQDKRILAKARLRAAIYWAFLAVMGRGANRPSGEPYALYWKADRELFAKINQRCTAEGTNSYSALCVAFLLAFRQIQKERAKNKLICPVSIRRYIRTLKADMMFSFAPTIELGLENQLQDFWEATRAMKDAMGKKIASLKVYEDLLLGEYLRASTARLVNFLRRSKGGHDVAFSNLGRIRIASAYKNFTIEAVVGATVAVPWRNATTLISTQFQGEMALNFVSNDGFLPRSEAVAIQQKALQLLFEAMSS
jgi:NRPS condensation-like uncharacterized protein